MTHPTLDEAKLLRKRNCHHWTYLTGRFGKDGSNCFLEKHVVTGYLPTHQHEVEHNPGILITDRKL